MSPTCNTRPASAFSMRVAVVANVRYFIYCYIRAHRTISLLKNDMHLIMRVLSRYC